MKITFYEGRSYSEKRKISLSSSMLFSIIILSLVFCLFQSLLMFPHNRQRFTVVKWSKEKFQPDNRRIFFHETSGRDYLDLRQSCAVESAARNNPSRPVQLFLQIDKLNYSRSFLSALEQYSNVAVILLNETEFFLDTPLEKWFLEGEWRYSLFKFTHMADYIRMLNLYKGGGLYMDLDYVSIAPINERIAQNFFAPESENATLLTNSVFHLDHGNQLIKEILKLLAKEYDPEKYYAHGPTLLTNLMKQNCSFIEGHMNSNRCKDVKLLSQNYFCPIPNWIGSWETLFSAPTDETFSKLNNSYAVHIWNSISKSRPYDANSKGLYNVLAARNCPLTIFMAEKWEDEND